MFCDIEKPRGALCRNKDATIPKGVMRIFTSNARSLEEWLEYFPDEHGVPKIPARDRPHYDAIKGAPHVRARVRVVYARYDMRKCEAGDKHRAEQKKAREAFAALQQKFPNADFNTL